MSEDRELLERAARAAGLELDWDVPPKSSPWVMTGQGEDRGPAHQWNPLTDDGDALRLAVKLDIATVFESDPDGETVTCRIEWRATRDCSELLGKDPYAATRRCIVRAAALLSPGEQS